MQGDLRAQICDLFQSYLDRFKHRELSQDEERRFTEFFLQTRFNQHCQAAIQPDSDEADQEGIPESDEDGASSSEQFLKYLVLGWYLYTQVMPSN